MIRSQPVEAPMNMLARSTSGLSSCPSVYVSCRHRVWYMGICYSEKCLLHMCMQHKMILSEAIRWNSEKLELHSVGAHWQCMSVCCACVCEDINFEWEFKLFTNNCNNHNKKRENYDVETYWHSLSLRLYATQRKKQEREMPITAHIKFNVPWNFPEW